jgi:hypothetical protein
LEAKTRRILSFSKDISPLFCLRDIEQMNVFGLLLDRYHWFSKPENARLVYAYLSGQRHPKIPLGGPYWSDQQLQVLLQWMNDGYQP